MSWQTNATINPLIAEIIQTHSVADAYLRSFREWHVKCQLPFEGSDYIKTSFSKLFYHSIED